MSLSSKNGHTTNNKDPMQITTPLGVTCSIHGWKNGKKKQILAKTLAVKYKLVEHGMNGR
jgi:hypothetical protein